VPADVKTCPKCGALITPQLARCRRCGTYLHGTSVEGFIFESLLPERLRGSPGTGLIMVICVLYYVLMAVLAGFDQVLAFSGFSLDQLGSTDPVGVLRGQYWRFVTSMFAHANVVHIAFNMSALIAAGPLVEEAWDRKKMLLIYLVSGVLAMAISFAWNALVRDNPFSSSVGASGANCGLIGAALFGARRMGPAGKDVAQGMKRWAIYTALFGLVPGIDNAAHAGGFVVGALFGQFVPLGMIKSVAANRLASAALLVGLLGIFGSFGLMIDNLRGYPVALEDDRYPRSMFFLTTYDGREWQYSGQKRALDACDERVQAGDRSPEAIQVCELAARAVPSDASILLHLAAMYDAAGNPAEAEKLRAIALRLIEAIRRLNAG
jgi:membrane associated rhomboid family serine protease